MSIVRLAVASTIGALALAPAASAHVTLLVQEARIGGGYKAVLRVPHGCKGAATTALAVQIPPGVIAVKPQPKPGWQIQIARGRYDKPYDFYGEPMTEGVKTLTWSGSTLPDEFYDEFVFNAFLDKGLGAGTKLYFPVVQTCGATAERWIEIPAAGKDADDYETPAPGLKLLPAGGGGD